MLDSVALAIKAILAFIPVSLMVVISTGIASMMGEFMGPAHYMHDAVVAFCTPVWLMVFAFAVLMFVWESIQCKIEERAMRKAGLMAVLLACLLPIGLQAEEVKYSSLEESAKLNLEKALVAGDSKKIESATKTLDTVVRARYLSGAAEINDSVSKLITEFKPQLDSLPTLIKGMGGVGALRNEQLFPQFAAAISGWLTANNSEAAKAALGDVEGLMQAQLVFDETFSKEMSKPYDPNDATPYLERKALALKAARVEADNTWASGK